MTADRFESTDVVIAGGGFAGLALAIALRQGLGDSFKVVVADPALGKSRADDARASAIAAAARRLFETIGVWDKVAGSAQRKLKGALLQHGSILLRTSEHAPELPGIHDLSGKELFSLESLAELLAKRFAVATGARVEPGEWSAKERDRATAIRGEKYANEEWNCRR
jgi:2-polyprenyl-6-methoxyphenol hydroxylase-like FAD-dependent oxidoreductase